jgi:phosphate starvation-inducible PhoH-like protein
LVGDIVDAYEKWQVVQDADNRADHQHGRQTGPGARRGEQRRGR